MSEEKDAFARRLRLACERTGLAYNEIAKRAGIDPGTFQNYTGGKSVPSLDYLRKICAALETTPNRLFGYRDDPGEGAEMLPPHREHLLAAGERLADRDQEALAAMAWTLVRHNENR